MVIAKRPFEIVADDLAARIRRGQWSHGQQLPAIRELEHLYPHSRVTIAKALGRLKEQGYLIVSPRSGAYVRSTHVRLGVGVLVGGLLSGGARSPLALTCQELASAYLHRCGFSIRCYTDDPRSPIGIPESLDEELNRGRLSGLLTIQSSFAYRHFLTTHWRGHAAPHVDIGTVPVDHQVFVDYFGFFERAIAMSRKLGAATVGLVDRGSGLRAQVLAQRFAGPRVSVLSGPAGLRRDLGHEEWGFRFAQDLCDRGALPAVLVIAEAHLAKGVVQAALMRGLSVPRDFQVITLVNRGLEVFIPAPVIRFAIDLHTLTALAGEMLIQLINRGDPAPRTILVPPELELAPTMITAAATSSPAQILDEYDDGVQEIQG